MNSRTHARVFYTGEISVSLISRELDGIEFDYRMLYLGLEVRVVSIC